QGHECELKIGMIDPGAAANEAAGFEMIRRRGAGLGEKPLQAGQVLARRPRPRGKADGLLATMLNDDVRMIVEIGADAAPVMLPVDSQPVQQVGRPNSR